MSGGVPAGWVLVPVEPTTEMTEAGEDVITYPADDFIRNRADSVWSAMLSAIPTPTPPIEGRDADVERVEAPENGEKRPDWAEIKRAIDYFVGRVPAISKHRAINNAHIRAVVERLDAAGDREAADTIVWQCWWRAIDAERERFLLADKDEQIAALQALGERP